jgi:hypothetical protein
MDPSGRTTTMSCDMAGAKPAPVMVTVSPGE